jgi:hypothetical protein
MIDRLTCLAGGGADADLLAVPSWLVALIVLTALAFQGRALIRADHFYIGLARWDSHERPVSGRSPFCGHRWSIRDN